MWLALVNRELSKFLEQFAINPDTRFNIIKTIKEKSKYIKIGILLMPVVPYLTDSVNNIEEVIKQAKAKGKDTKAAEASLSRTIDKIPHNHKVGPKDYDYTKLDDFRWEIAQQILKIMK